MAPYDATASGAWKQAAACSGTAANVFYPDTDVATKTAKAICARCAVKSQCLEVALRNKERHGVWGGLTERERSRLQRRLRAA